MKTLIVITITFLSIASSSAQAERCQSGEQPWLVYGQTLIPAATALNNPVTNANGLIGEANLPYVVPAGKILVITSYAMEGYDYAGISVIFPFIGQSTTAPFNSQAFASAGADSGSMQMRGPYHIPAGKIVNVRMINGTNRSSVFGWAVHGCLKKH